MSLEDIDLFVSHSSKKRFFDSFAEKLVIVNVRNVLPPQPVDATHVLNLAAGDSWLVPLRSGMVLGVGLGCRITKRSSIWGDQLGC
jgi:hypothetical protein